MKGTALDMTQRFRSWVHSEPRIAGAPMEWEGRLGKLCPMKGLFQLSKRGSRSLHNAVPICQIRSGGILWFGVDDTFLNLLHAYLLWHKTSPQTR